MSDSPTQDNLDADAAVRKARNSWATAVMDVAAKRNFKLTTEDELGPNAVDEQVAALEIEGQSKIGKWLSRHMMLTYTLGGVVVFGAGVGLAVAGVAVSGVALAIAVALPASFVVNKGTYIARAQARVRARPLPTMAELSWNEKTKADLELTDEDDMGARASKALDANESLLNEFQPEARRQFKHAVLRLAVVAAGAIFLPPGLPSSVAVGVVAASAGDKVGSTLGFARADKLLKEHKVDRGEYLRAAREIQEARDVMEIIQDDQFMPSSRGLPSWALEDEGVKAKAAEVTELLVQKNSAIDREHLLGQRTAAPELSEQRETSVESTRDAGSIADLA